METIEVTVQLHPGQIRPLLTAQQLVTEAEQELDRRLAQRDLVLGAVVAGHDVEGEIVEAVHLNPNTGELLLRVRPGGAETSSRSE